MSSGRPDPDRVEGAAERRAGAGPIGSVGIPLKRPDVVSVKAAQSLIVSVKRGRGSRLVAVERAHELRQAARDSGGTAGRPPLCAGRGAVLHRATPARAVLLLAARCCEGDFVPQQFGQRVCSTCKPLAVSA